MKHDFHIQGIQHQAIKHITSLTDAALKASGVIKMKADANPGYPCRVSLQDAEIGEEVLLFSYEHHKVDSPYSAAGPIYIRTNDATINLDKNTIPKMLEHRLLSLRVYNTEAMMIDALTIKGKELENVIQDIFDKEESAYIHVHNAGPGCYNCQINRV